ncbi:MAG: enoyl-ACP reductase [Bacteriovoracaceae bacterium]|nr:enoyl-ACP reductase [Bacteriovoracaceae bacterium]
MEVSGLLKGKKALILGLANDRSIAWGITQAFARAGARIGLTYMNDLLKKRVEPLSQEITTDFLCEMDVTNDDHYPQLKKVIEEKWGTFDILVHSLAFADKTDLAAPFSETTRKGFALACDISAFSLVGLCGTLKDIINPEGSVMSLTYYGSQKVVGDYKIMGVAKAALEASSLYLAADLGPKSIRVNCISAGPIKTLAASGVPGFRDILKDVEERAPLRRNVTPDDVGGTALYLASDLSKAVTGQILYVDSGHSTVAI